MSLAAARHLSAGDFHAEAICRSYYACFHAARSALLVSDLAPTMHTVVRTEFSKTFVRTGHFDSGTAKTLGWLQKEREDADYGRGFSWDKPAADEAMNSAGQFIDAVLDLLTHSGYSPNALGPPDS